MEAPSIPDLPLPDRLRDAAAHQPVYPDGRFAGRGIIICAGGARLFTCAWVAIALLRRHLGCTMPIEVWHLGPEELGPPMRGLLQELDAETVDAFEVARRHPVAALGGWQLKTYALLHSRFREVLLLDADNVPVRDPSPLFDDPAYQQTGALFWPDIVRFRAGNAIWDVTGLTPDRGPSFESGQLVLDKARCWRALGLADWVNQRHVNFENIIFGDKDAFYLGWRLTETLYHLVGHRPRLLEHTLCQSAPDGRLMFQHRNGAKWLLYGTNPRVEAFRWEEQCFTLLSELRTLWDGWVFNPPERSAAARAWERELIRTCHVRIVWVSSHEIGTELLDQHRIGPAAGSDHRYWFVSDGPTGLMLHIVGNGMEQCALAHHADGSWRGTGGRFQVELHAGSAASDGAVAAGTADVLAVLDRVLTAGSRMSARSDLIDAYATTLATVAGLDPAGRRYLEDVASTADGARVRLATMALERCDDGAPRHGRGTGWRHHGAIMTTLYEPLPKQ